MNTYIALFRGINIGGKNLLPMKELVGYFEAAGCSNVRSYIQSGNVVFDSRKKFGGKDVAGIAGQVLAAKGFEPKIMLLTQQDLLAAVQNNPFPTDVGKALHFLFLESVPKQPDLVRLESIKAGSEAFVLRDKVFYLYAPDGIGRSKLVASVERLLGVPVTGRNWNTVSKLMEMAG